MVDSILDEMKSAGYKAALVRKDGQLFKSNFQIDDPLPSIISSFLNVSDALIKQSKGEGREYEMQLEDSVLVAIPVSDYYLVSYIDNREKKKIIREYADKIKLLL